MERRDESRSRRTHASAGTGENDVLQYNIVKSADHKKCAPTATRAAQSTVHWWQRVHRHAESAVAECTAQEAHSADQA